MSKKITRIEPTAALPETPDSFGGRKEKVAAYARVSTEKDEQHTSFEAQVDYYKKKILENPGWEFVGVYADDGLSGTSFHRRGEFNRMIEDCRAGKITMILTKSISRFARNTVDTIKFIRELKDLGIGVMFEKENIWSLDSKGEFLMTVMSSIAQEESRSISENVAWGHRKKMTDGKYSVAYSNFLGYDKGKKDELVINEEEAVIVRRIFSLFIQGYSTHAIGQMLDVAAIPTPAGRPHWSLRTLNSILSNEKYKGDALLQKTFTLDYLSKKQRKNNGEFPQYYVKNGHPAIIDPELFDYVQEIQQQRDESDRFMSGQIPFSSKMVCGVCGNFFGTRPWHVTDHVWGCRERSRTGHTCQNMHVYDYALWYQLKEILQRVIKSRPVVQATCKRIISDKITDNKRRDAALKCIQTLMETSPDNLEFGEEPAFIFKTLTFYPDNHANIVLVDGTELTHHFRKYTTKVGWWKDGTEQPEEEPLKAATTVGTDEASLLAAAEIKSNSSAVLTRQKRAQIDALRREGLGYKRIANQMGVSVNTVKSYCRRKAKKLEEEGPQRVQVEGGGTAIPCQNCGRLVLQTPGRKMKKFCNKTCRNTWWNSHLSEVNRSTEAMYEITCKTCGRRFSAYGNRNRKYCSHECYIKDRFGV